MIASFGLEASIDSAGIRGTIKSSTEINGNFKLNEDLSVSAGVNGVISIFRSTEHTHTSETQHKQPSHHTHSQKHTS